jgi:hypothetical protein
MEEIWNRLIDEHLDERFFELPGVILIDFPSGRVTTQASVSIGISNDLTSTVGTQLNKFGSVPGLM